EELTAERPEMQSRRRRSAGCIIWALLTSIILILLICGSVTLYITQSQQNVWLTTTNSAIAIAPASQDPGIPTDSTIFVGSSTWRDLGTCQSTSPPQVILLGLQIQYFQCKGRGKP